MAHDWSPVSWDEKFPLGLHPFDQARRCLNCKRVQKRETLYDFNSYSNRGGPKVRGYSWSPLVGRCKAKA